MSFFQPQNIIKSDFFLTSFHKKTVTVDQKNTAENNYNDFTGIQNHPDFIDLWNCLFQTGTVPEKVHHIHHGNAENAGEHIGNICFSVISDVLKCKSGEQSFTHDDHRLSSG